jgi:CrcB protein
LRELQHILLIAGCGALGAICRYGVGAWSNHYLTDRFPLGTLLVNVVGCFLIGLVMQMADHGAVSPLLKTALVVGFLGALTTFSAFGHDTFRHFEAGDHLHALVNIGSNMLLGLAAVWAGVVAGRFFAG